MDKFDTTWCHGKTWFNPEDRGQGNEDEEDRTAMQDHRDEARREETDEAFCSL
jgi:hypothetical protein